MKEFYNGITIRSWVVAVVVVVIVGVIAVITAEADAVLID